MEHEILMTQQEQIGEEGEPDHPQIAQTDDAIAPGASCEHIPKINDINTNINNNEKKDNMDINDEDTDSKKEIIDTEYTTKDLDITETKMGDETHKDIKRLVSKYYLWYKHKEARKRIKLEDISKNGEPHINLQSFSFIPENIPIVLVMGETGTGKSSLCNKLGGVYYKLETEIIEDEDGDDEIISNIITLEGQKELFIAKESTDV